MNLPIPACAVCGHTLVETARFCPGCGRRVGAAAHAHSHYMTVLICDLSGSTAMTHAMGDEAMFALITRFQRICTDAVGAQGGLVAKFMGDGMLAYFGHPEPVKNSAEAAVCAADHILSAMSGLAPDLSASAGVATGWMVIGDMYDMGPASETLAVGGTVNLAARLQSEAGPREIAVSGETRRRLDPARFKMTPRGRRTLRGLHEPVELWSAVPLASGVSQSLFVGRRAALSQLGSAWEGRRDGGPWLCEIVAPAGYGKTAIARHFIANTVNEANTLELRAERHLRMQSFSCFRNLVRSVGGLTPGTGADDQRGRLATLVADDHVPGLLDLMGLNQVPVSPVLRLSRMAESVLAFLSRRLPESAAVLLLDDAHWLDPDSRALLPRIMSVLESRNIAILAPRRPDGGPLLPGTVTIELAPFGREESAELIGALDDTDRIPATDRRALAARAAGVPLYLEHMTRAVLERRAAGQPTALPNTIVEALIERAASVGASRGLIEAVAVLGVDVRTDVLADMLGRADEDVRDRVAELIARGLLTLSGNGRIEFDHALVRDALLSTILSDRRRDLHRKALAAYGRLAPGALAADPILASIHLYGAGRPTEALPVMIEAAKAQIGGGELREAAEVLRRARDTLPQVADPDLRERIEMPLQYLTGATLVQIRGFSDPTVGTAYERALDLCLRRGDATEAEFQIVWGIWAHCVVVGRLDEASASCRRMEEIARTLPGLGVLARSARAVQASIDVDLPAHHRAVADVRGAYDLATHRMLAVTYTMDPLALALLFATHVRWIEGDVPGWEAAVTQTRRLEDALELGFLAPYIAIYGTAPETYAPGDADRARRIADGIETAAEIGQPFWVAAGHVWRAGDLCWRSPPSEAIPAMRAAMDTQIAIGQTLGAGYHMARLAERYAAHGDAQEAEAWIRRAEAELSLGRCRLYRPEILRLRARIGMLAGADVAALLDEADARAVADGLHAWRWMIAATRADATARRDRRAAAETLRGALATLERPAQERHGAYRYASAVLDRLEGADGRDGMPRAPEASGTENRLSPERNRG
ncbi:adenylate/guanylate cyclase domain-containing protein [Palleronia rufa]|uniref:adenylate/guanylate cyclase domain-containing protein n=1 Tax=Palleronia rufa TaxID=1530186 RepID=UPI000569BB3C|nr:adenylate/guanylate cyclase domain-containing protein [Palleronia rufa]